MFRPGLIRSVCLALTVAVPTAFTLSGCAMPSADDPNLSPAEQQLRQQSANFDKTILEGAGIGAVAGALLGGLFDSNHLQGAAIGAAGGAALGGAAGYGVAENNQSQASTESAYNDQISAARTSAEEFNESARTAETVAYEATTEASRLQAEYASQQISADGYHAALQKYADDNEALSKTIAAAQKQEAALRDAAASSSYSERRRLNASANNIHQSAEVMLEQQQQITSVLDETPGGAAS
jgi:hypothetical protein